MNKRVVITGQGLISAFSDRPEDFHEALCQGDTAIGPLSWEDELPELVVSAAQISEFDPRKYLGGANLRPLDRAGLLAVSGAKNALESSGWTEAMRQETSLDLVLGTMFCGPHTITQFDRAALTKGPRAAKPLDFANTVINAAAGHTAIWHGLSGESIAIASGPTSGMRALLYAARRITLGRSQAILTGGVEELGFEINYALHHSQHLHQGSNCLVRPYGDDRSGFALGEGCAFLMLEEYEAAVEREANILAEICGYGSSFDPHQGGDEGAAIDAIVRSIRAAIEEAGLESGQIGCLSVSGNGSPTDDRREAWALEKVFGQELPQIPLFAIAGAIGETLGAGGTMQTLALVESARRGRIPGTIGAVERDAALPRLRLLPTPIEATFDYSLALSVGFDGSSVALVIKTHRSL